MSLEKRIDYYCLDGSKFRKITDLKGGSFGSISIVEEDETNNRYIAKVMSNFNQYENHKYFLRELDIFMRVRNCCIIGFKGFSFQFNELNIPTIFLEYAECGSIQSKLDGYRRNNPDQNWTPTKRMISLIGVAYGMMKLHEQNVIHRDLKPGNVLLDSNYHPKITDFGLSKFENKNLEQSISGCGTPIYMAPEVISSFDFTNSVDVFAFSIMAYELITLRFPYQLRPKETPLGIIQRVCMGMRPKFKEDDDISPQLKDLLERCWSENPSDRYTFKEIVDLLVQKEYIIPNVDNDELSNYISILSRNSDISNESNEVIELIKKADTGDRETIKTVADNFFEGKNGFPRDETKALFYYRLLSKSEPKKDQASDVYMPKTVPVTAREKKDSSKPLKRSQTVVVKSPVNPLEIKEKLDFVKLTQCNLQKQITCYNVFVIGDKTARKAVINVFGKNQTFSQNKISRYFTENRIYGCGISLIEAKKIGKITEDEIFNFIKERSSNKSPEEKLRHGFYCLIGNDESIFTDHDERVIKYLSKSFMTTIFVLDYVNKHFVESMFKRVQNCYMIEDAMTSLKNVKKGPIVVTIPSNDEAVLIQKIQNFINFIPNIS